MRKWRQPTVGLFFLIATSGFILPNANAEEFRHHEAHEHGVAHLNAAIEGQLVLIEFVSPAANIVGFEYAPKTEEQKTAVKQAIASLENGAQMILFSSGAKSSLTNATVTTDVAHDKKHEGHDQHGHDQDGHHHDDEDHGNKSHSEFKAEYNFRVENPEKLKFLDILLFQAFPGIDHMEVQLLTTTRQTALELTAKNHRIDL